MTTDQILGIKKEFEDAAYKDLKEVFEKYKVADLWRGGVKKEELIQLALQKLEQIGLPQTEQVEQQLDETTDVVNEEIQDPNDIETQAEQVELAHVFTRQQIQDNIKIVDANLIQPSDHQRKLLLEKRAYLEQLLLTTEE